jgi:hypothetical protein
MIILTNLHQIPFRIDEDVFEIVSRYTWHMYNGYPETSIKTSDGRWRSIFIYKFLYGKAPVGFEWDYINQDRADNRRINLRIVTRTVNQHNRRLNHTNESGVAGVKRDGNSWSATICYQGKQLLLGTFKSVDDAIKARLLGEQTYWGTQR